MSGQLSSLTLRFRRPIVVLVHMALWLGSFFGAFLLRFDFQLPAAYQGFEHLGWVLPLLALRAVAYAHYGLFHGLWRYSGARDLENLLKATVGSSLVFAVLVQLAGVHSFPRSVYLVEFLLAFVLAGGLRFATRAFAQVATRIERGPKRRMLIVGAGDAGEMLLREIHRNLTSRYEVVGLVDDNVHKGGVQIHGVAVLGTTERIPELIVTHEITEVVIAIPTATGKQMRRIVSLCGSEVAVRTVPAVEHLINGRVTINEIREVDIEDLLGRDPVDLDMQRISGMIRDRVVLVTGAGGSIGSELCRQVARFRPNTLVLVEQAENNLYHIDLELRASFSRVAVVPCIADVCDVPRLRQIFSKYRPDLVFHAAAHKHVPMMEHNPCEAVKNNVVGTRAVADACHEAEVERFVMVSTDKAVNPTSVMGCTKRAAELYIQSCNGRSETMYVTVRFGNVLGSAGSVIPLFKKQIAAGGPVTVTHPDMERYFMTIPEASQLVLQACALGERGEVFLLDMGEPVKIVTLARDLISLSGLRPDEDIEVVFSGIRPGEKLFEELAIHGENVQKTKHPKIFIGSTEQLPWEQANRHVDALGRIAVRGDDAAIRTALRELVPTYTGDRDQDRAVVISLR